MNLEINISSTTAAWLEKRAQATGLDEASVAANVLETIAGQELTRNGHSAAERLRHFREWADSRPPRPGPAVDASRASIYD